MGRWVEGVFPSDTVIGAVKNAKEKWGLWQRRLRGQDMGWGVPEEVTLEPGEEEERARQRGWAVGEHSRPEPAFFSEYQNPADFSPRRQ